MVSQLGGNSAVPGRGGILARAAGYGTLVGLASGGIVVLGPIVVSLVLWRTDGWSAEVSPGTFAFFAIVVTIGAALGGAVGAICGLLGGAVLAVAARSLAGDAGVSRLAVAAVTAGEIAVLLFLLAWSARAGLSLGLVAAGIAVTGLYGAIGALLGPRVVHGPYLS